MAAVADDLRALIDGMFRPVAAPPGYLAAGADLTKDLANYLAAVVRAPKVSLPHIFEPHSETGYSGGYLAFTTPHGDEEQVWITVTATGSDYAPLGEPASLWLSFTDERPPHRVTRQALEPLGFEDRPDRAGYRMFRAGRPLEAERLADDLDAVRPHVRAWALGLLTEAALTTGQPPSDGP